jgi:hypothetical protein
MMKLSKLATTQSVPAQDPDFPARLNVSAGALGTARLFSLLTY